ncbi:soluble calcium-activated nucleotidase 1 [Diorhabda carinulata]|uniref:soluble calcium-activated nucleotidase 1 n=1 Tax=Diorhabda carinulata TaxID=1163345 RepID=UPI0025A22C77|nr:soluble calcium-activated nucleotidase 1 [Diorhabda carinulata]
MSPTRDWRKALKSQPTYRIGNKTICCQTFFVYSVGITGMILLFCLYTSSTTRSTSNYYIRSNYNYTYPITRPIKTSTMHIFKIGVIADLDQNSRSDKEKNTWYSYLKTGYLSYNLQTHRIIINWDQKEPIVLTTSYALNGRGLELSELLTFDGRLLTFDDRTGIVFELINNNKNIIPWLILMDGNGKSLKGFKSEWATVKDEVLHIGSIGKEWTTATGEFVNNDPQFIKTITKEGYVKHINWVDQYNKLRSIIGISWPGYMIHESALWSDVHQQWFFLPRRCSKEPYNESLDEHRGCSVLLRVDPEFHNINVIEIGNAKPTRGFSSFKFIPTSNDEVIIALRTEELNGNTATYITAFTIDGKILLEDEHIADDKYEGLEFI